MEKIEPVMSAEEWAKWDTPYGRVLWQSARAACHDDVRDSQKLAALSLHGQPYGFTWQDVDMLRQAAGMNGGDGSLPNPSAERFTSLADRIEALLPPRPPQEDAD